MKRAIRIAVAVLAVAAFSGAVQAGHENNLVTQIHRIETYANELEREVKLHFRHTAEYRHLLGDAASIRKEAEHLDSIVHHVHSGSDLRHVKADLKDLDRLVHHVGDLIEDIEHGHGRGHTHGDTRHVRALVASITRSVHYMGCTVRSMEAEFRSHHYRSDRGEHFSHGRSGRSGRSGRFDRRRGPQRIAAQIVREVWRHR